MKESNVVHIAAPVTVVGDIHGQFFDMLEIFKIGGFCPNTNYLFLGETIQFLESHIYGVANSLQEIMLTAASSASKPFPSSSVSSSGTHNASTSSEETTSPAA